MTEPDPAASVAERFTHRFGHRPAAVVHAPGRVNLIGEHTDYNDGFVLPMALARGVHIAFEPTDDDRVTAIALDYDEQAEFRSSDLAPDRKSAPRGHWTAYVKGTAWALRETGDTIRGWRGVIAGDVPVGAGLSSSAALEMAVARAFCASSGLAWDAREMALAGQRAEHRFAGVACGIMDQMACAAGIVGSALMLDCRTLEFERISLPAALQVVILDTRTRRGLVDSAYNARRRQCEEAARHFGVAALRDLDLAAFEARAGELDREVAMRARHVLSENARTVAAADALRQGDGRRMGELMYESHLSLREDFEVSTTALDALVECAMAEPDCHGARMTGAGFGGCAVALVRNKQVDLFIQQVAESYARATGHRLVAYT